MGGMKWLGLLTVSAVNILTCCGGSVSTATLSRSDLVGLLLSRQPYLDREIRDSSYRQPLCRVTRIWIDNTRLFP